LKRQRMQLQNAIVDKETHHLQNVHKIRLKPYLASFRTLKVPLVETFAT